MIDSKTVKCERCGEVTKILSGTAHDGTPVEVYDCKNCGYLTVRKEGEKVWQEGIRRHISKVGK